jgi:hypothetical protein
MWKLQTIPHIRAHSPHNNLNYSFNLNSNDSSNPNTLNSNPNPNLNLKNDHRHHNTGAYPKSSKSAAIYPSMPMSN